MSYVRRKIHKCPLPGSIQGQAGWDFGQPGLEEGVPAYSRELEPDDLKGPKPTQIIP